MKNIDHGIFASSQVREICIGSRSIRIELRRDRARRRREIFLVMFASRRHGETVFVDENAVGILVEDEKPLRPRTFGRFAHIEEEIEIGNEPCRNEAEEPLRHRARFLRGERRIRRSTFCGAAGVTAVSPGGSAATLTATASGVSRAARGIATMAGPAGFAAATVSGVGLRGGALAAASFAACGANIPPDIAQNNRGLPPGGADAVKSCVELTGLVSGVELRRVKNDEDAHRDGHQHTPKRPQTPATWSHPIARIGTRSSGVWFRGF